MSPNRDAWTEFVKHRGAPEPARKRPNKFGAKKWHVDGITFDSTRECDRYQELKILIGAGLISELTVHPAYPLQVVELYKEGPPWVIDTIGIFHADFRYRDHRTGTLVIEDVKSKPTKTEAYQLRKKIVEAVHGITVVEI